MTDDELAAAREAGRRAAEQAIQDQAPDDPLLRIAWAAGHGGVDAVKAAVEAARTSGQTWAEIARALDENASTVRVRYSQPDRWRKYVERKKQHDDG